MNSLATERATPSRALASRAVEGAGARAATSSLSCRDVHKSYSVKGGVVLHGVSLTIDEGERVALIGPNGSGKSTLLRSLVGLHRVDRGTVQVLGRELRNGQLDRETRRQVGFVFQNHGLVMRLSALSNVIHGRLGFAGSWRAWHQSIAPDRWRREAFEALAAVGLERHAEARADQLSGGQAQRVAIARALVRKPRLMIADEPAASLDPKTGMDVMETFASVAARSGTTLIYTTHDMVHALRFADRVVALKGGHVVLDQRTADLGADDLDRFFHDA